MDGLAKDASGQWRVLVGLVFLSWGGAAASLCQAPLANEGGGCLSPGSSLSRSALPSKLCEAGLLPSALFPQPHLVLQSLLGTGPLFHWSCRLVLGGERSPCCGRTQTGLWFMPAPLAKMVEAAADLGSAPEFIDGVLAKVVQDSSHHF